MPILAQDALLSFSTNVKKLLAGRIEWIGRITARRFGDNALPGLAVCTTGRVERIISGRILNGGSPEKTFTVARARWSGIRRWGLRVRKNNSPLRMWADCIPGFIEIWHARFRTIGTRSSHQCVEVWCRSSRLLRRQWQSTLGAGGRLALIYALVPPNPNYLVTHSHVDAAADNH